MLLYLSRYFKLKYVVGIGMDYLNDLVTMAALIDIGLPLLFKKKI